MRLPDLDWPANLFADGAAAIPDTAAMPSAPIVTQANLWRKMVGTWTARHVSPELQWHFPLPEANPALLETV